ncbi:MAG: diphthine--ammonia ligase [Nitrososphaerota archaeon]|nr:diphthine--ammonia ligase [Candidatus Calditenuis fumarioli]
MRLAVSWSTGKDSAMALHRVLSSGRHRVVCLLTTLTEGYGRVTMHGVRRELLHAQASSLGLEVFEVWIPPNAPNEVYEERMGRALAELSRRYGVEGVVFGDIWLEDVRRYREERMRDTGIEPLFPLWGEDPLGLVEEFLRLGYRALVAVVDADRLDPSRFLGRTLTLELLEELREVSDPAGERGEYHTFVFDGPVFSQPVAFRTGEVVVRDGRFHFIDLLPA